MRMVRMNWHRPPNLAQCRCDQLTLPFPATEKATYVGDCSHTCRSRSAQSLQSQQAEGHRETVGGNMGKWQEMAGQRDSKGTES